MLNFAHSESENDLSFEQKNDPRLSENGPSFHVKKWPDSRSKKVSFGGQFRGRKRSFRGVIFGVRKGSFRGVEKGSFGGQKGVVWGSVWGSQNPPPETPPEWPY